MALSEPRHRRDSLLEASAIPKGAEGTRPFVVLAPVLQEVVGPKMSGCQGCSYLGISTAVEDNFVGVRVGEESNLTLCTTRGRIYAQGEPVVVEMEAGPTFGHVARSPMPIFKPCQKAGARPISRPANDRDQDAQNQRRRRSERSSHQHPQPEASHGHLFPGHGSARDC